MFDYSSRSWQTLILGAENATAVPQGFVTRDRRKESVREADQRLAELEHEYAAAQQEGAPEDGSAAAAEEGGFVLEDVFTDSSQFEAVLHTLRLAAGQRAAPGSPAADKGHRAHVHQARHRQVKELSCAF